MSDDSSRNPKNDQSNPGAEESAAEEWDDAAADMGEADAGEWDEDSAGLEAPPSAEEMLNEAIFTSMDEAELLESSDELSITVEDDGGDDPFFDLEEEDELPPPPGFDEDELDDAVFEEAISGSVVAVDAEPEGQELEPVLQSGTIPAPPDEDVASVEEELDAELEALVDAGDSDLGSAGDESRTRTDTAPFSEAVGEFASRVATGSYPSIDETVGTVRDDGASGEAPTVAAEDARDEAQDTGDEEGDGGGDEPVAADDPISGADGDDASGAAGRDQGEAEGPGRPAIDPLPLSEPAPTGRDSWSHSFERFRRESQRLARAGRWRELAAVTAHALLNAEYATGGTLASMLLDLARIHRDRLNDARRAEEAFAALAQHEPASAEAIEFLSTAWRERGEWNKIFDLYVRAVEATWDPHERLRWTERAASVAQDRIGDPNLAARAWENLWKLGDAVEEAARALGRYYRRAGRWEELASFLEKQAAQRSGPPRWVTLHELAELRLTALDDPDGAMTVLATVMSEHPGDEAATQQLARLYAENERWDSLVELGRSGELDPEQAVERYSMVGELLWEAGRRSDAIAMYDRVLEFAPGDALAEARKTEFLRQSHEFQDLLTMLVARADETDDPEQKAQHLAQAAELAEHEQKDLRRAIELWERRLEIDLDRSTALAALERLYPLVDAPEEYATTLEKLLDITDDSAARKEYLKKLGDLAAERLGDDDRALACWRAALEIDPLDFGVRSSLMALHERRGDDAALVEALERQLWLERDPDARLAYAARLARTVDATSEDAKERTAAWRRVLDLAPARVEALEGLAASLEAAGDLRALIEVLERLVRLADDPEDRARTTLRIARLWEEEDDALEAAAAYERLLRWDPRHEEAIDGLERIYGASGHTTRAVEVLEYAASIAEQAADKVGYLRRILALAGVEDPALRFAIHERIAALNSDDEAARAGLREEAERGELWERLAATITYEESEAREDSDRRRLRRELATLLEEKLDAPERAYAVLAGSLVSDDQPAELLDDLRRIAPTTERWEDFLELLEQCATSEHDIALRKERIAERASVLEREMEHAERSFYEWSRALLLDPHDANARANLDRIARAYGLWRDYERRLRHLVDAAHDAPEQVSLLERRETIFRESLEDRGNGFELTLHRYRHVDTDGQATEIESNLSRDADALEAWEAVTPLFAARWSARDKMGEGTLTSLAQLYETKLDAPRRAFDFYAAALRARPDDTGLVERLYAIAETTGTFERLAQVFRTAAALAMDHEVKLALLRRATGLLERDDVDSDEAIELRRRLLDLDADDLESLDIVIAQHRQREEWRDLVQGLRQRLRLVDDDEEQVEVLAEIARISGDALGEREEALAAWRTLLEIDPDHDAARSGAEEIIAELDDPDLMLSWLREKRERTTGEDELTELSLQIAALQRDALDDPLGAVETLEDLWDTTGPDGPAAEPLLELLRGHGRWADVVRILLSQADAADAERDERRLRRDALDISLRHRDALDDERREQLYRQLLEHDPDDVGVRRELSVLLRRSGRAAELDELIVGGMEHVAEGLRRRMALGEHARLLAMNLDKAGEAEAVWRQVLREFDGDEGARFALASAAKERGNLESYLSHRAEQAESLPDEEAALVYCHLAEVCEENESLRSRMVEYYREARKLDPQNEPAMQALKSIGRRAKSIRPTAALLPIEGEREMEWAQRAEQLRTLGDEQRSTDPLASLDWLRRAVAVDPDSVDAWRSLAQTLAVRGDDDEALRARRNALEALERTRPLDPNLLREEAQLAYDAATAARAAGDESAASAYVLRAYELAPEHIPTVVAMSSALLDRGEVDRARIMLASLIQDRSEEIPSHLLPDVYEVRGRVARALGNLDEAQDDLTQALRLAPLHVNALDAMADLREASDDPAGAVEYRIRALTVTQEPSRRARLYFNLGTTWEDGLGDTSSAGACYELAHADGFEGPELMRRLLWHYQRDGQLDRSLEILDRLMPDAASNEELADLWKIRGELFAGIDGREDDAIEAFDMALSYDPGCHGARRGLAAIFERREDWDQLLDLLDAIAEAAADDEAVETLLRMADVCLEQLDDPERAESYLRQAAELDPSRKVLERLVSALALKGAPAEERVEVLTQIVRSGPPWYRSVVEIGELLLESSPRQAWALLSPALVVKEAENELKQQLKEMRRAYERPPLLAAEGRAYRRTIPDAYPSELAEVFAELAELLPIGAQLAELAGDVTEVSPHSNIGKSFGVLAAGFGMPDVSLYRADMLDEPIAILRAAEDDPCIAVRSDILQQLVRAEVGFAFGYALELVRPAHRGVASLHPDDRPALVPALWQAIGFDAPQTPASEQLAEEIIERVAEETRDLWAERLLFLRAKEIDQLSSQWWRSVRRLALRTGLVAGADMMQVFRALSRMSSDVDRPSLYASFDELDDYISSDDDLADLVVFAASTDFGKALDGATELE